ncbi:MAG: hypothetical protein MUD01_04295 [Chloroflexaceae bacterium]|jgi:acyl carrier protein|nr:hypothetical protein [Chloroflexaceae bacterium]
MNTLIQPDTITSLVLERLRDVLQQTDRPIPADMGEQTQLVGKQAVLTSLGLVTLIVDLEQSIEEEYDAVITIADDRAMSQQHSPFRTVGSLAAYIATRIAEEQGRG